MVNILKNMNHILQLLWKTVTYRSIIFWRNCFHNLAPAEPDISDMRYGKVVVEVYCKDSNDTVDSHSCKDFNG